MWGIKARQGGRLALVTVWNEREKTGQSNTADIAYKMNCNFTNNNVVKGAGVCCLGGRLSCEVLRETLDSKTTSA